MTILNLWVSPQRAIVATDTAGLMPGGIRREVSKMFPITHCNALLAARGHIDHTLSVLQRLVTVPSDFDSMVDRLPEAIDGAATHMNAFAAEQGIDFLIDAQTTILVGWSQKRRSMVCMHFFFDLADGVKVERKDSFFAPGMDQEAGTPESSDCAKLLSTPQGIERLARRQIAWAARTNQAQHFGGRLLVAELTKDQLTIRTTAPLDRL